MWVILFWEASPIIIKWDWGTFFPKIGKWISPTIKDKNVTYSNSSLMVWIERKYAIDSIPVKSYKKGFAFLVTLKLSFPEASKGAFTIACLV